MTNPATLTPAALALAAGVSIRKVQYDLAQDRVPGASRITCGKRTLYVIPDTAEARAAVKRRSTQGRKPKALAD